jgi:hypothetical protein
MLAGDRRGSLDGMNREQTEYEIDRLERENEEMRRRLEVSERSKPGTQFNDLNPRMNRDKSGPDFIESNQRLTIDLSPKRASPI